MRDLPLEEHLEELRRRLLVCLIPAALLLIPLLLQSAYLMDAIYAPLLRLGITVSSYQITDGLILRLRIAVTVDILMMLPLILWQGYAFMRPGLYRIERIVLSVFLGFGTVLFYFALYFFIAKLTPVLAAYWYHSQTIAVIISTERYFSIWQAAALIFGVAAALLPVGLFLIWRIRNWRKAK